MKIIGGGLADVGVQDLLEHHVRTARSETTPGSAHALNLEGLTSADVTFWSAWAPQAAVAKSWRDQIDAHSAGQSPSWSWDRHATPHHRCRQDDGHDPTRSRDRHLGVLRSGAPPR